MAQIDGFSQYYDYLGLDRSKFLIQFASDLSNNYSGTFHPEISTVGSSNSPREIQNAAVLNSSEWTQLFVYNKTGSGQGILFSSLQGNYPYSGYTIGLTDDNKIYFETYDNNGPVVRVGSHINSTRNAMAVSMGNNTVSFNYFNFEDQETETESFPIQSQYVLPQARAFLNGSQTLPSYTSGKNFPGSIDTYVYVANSLAPDSLDVLFSGFYSYYDNVAGEVTSTSYQEITGYNMVPYGHSGITGYQTNSGIVGSGADGSPTYQYTIIALSGFIEDGVDYQPLTGITTVYSTGDSTYSLIVDTGYANKFTMNAATLLLPLNVSGSKALFYGSQNTNDGVFNSNGTFNRVESHFDLPRVYNDMDVQIYLNGSALTNAGYEVTGNVYGSGYRVSGDYFLKGLEVYTKSPVVSTALSGNPAVSIPVKNFLSFDYIPSGQKFEAPFTAHASGSFVTVRGGITNLSAVFIDGQQLSVGIDYNVASSGIALLTNKYASYQGTGLLSVFYYPSDTIFASLDPTQSSSMSGKNYQRGTSRMFWLGKRLRLGADYLENSSLDFLKRRTIVDSNMALIYNGEGQYFE